MIDRRHLLRGLVVSAGAGLLAGCGADPAPRHPMPVATGESGGVYRPLGQALAAAMRSRWHPDALLTSGSVDNLDRLRATTARVAFSTVDVAAQALAGLGGFDEKFKIRALAGLYSDYVHVVVRAGSATYDLDGLAGQPVSTGAPGSGTEVVALRMMAAAGITVRGFERHRLGLIDSVAALRTGIIDAFFFSGGLPTPAIGDLMRSGDLPARLLDLGRYLDTLQGQFGEVYRSGWIPNSVYGSPSVDTVCIPNVLAVPPGMSADTGYRLTRLLFAAKPKLAAAHPEGHQLDPRSALATYPVPLHHGAERYYRELKQA